MKGIAHYSTTLKALKDVVEFLESKYGNFDYAEKPKTAGDKTFVVAKVKDCLVKVEINNVTGKWIYEEI